MKCTDSLMSDLPQNQVHNTGNLFRFGHDNMFVEAYSVDSGSSGPPGALVVEAVAVDAYGSNNSTGLGAIPVEAASARSPNVNTTQPQNGPGTTPPVYQEPEYEANPVMSPQSVELYENERYSPRLGFSGKGLIIGDRGNFSNAHGTWSFNTVEEAAGQLISRGWHWTSDWQIIGTDSFGTVTPYAPSAGGGEEGGGWLYSPDFGSYSQGKYGVPKKGLTHFVRRRKLMRIRQFDESTICNDSNHTCMSCDGKQVEQLSNMFIDLFYGALFAKYPTKELKLLKIIKMKNLFIDALMAPVNVRAYSFDSVAAIVNAFAHSQKRGGLLTRFNPSDPYCRQVEQQFPLLERVALARAAIRKYDGMFEYHCNAHICGATCPFAVHRCPHTGCEVRFSKRWWGEHDAACPFKVVPCVLQCGMFMPRNRCAEHARDSCIMRRVPCPYAKIGCNPEGLIFRDVEVHCNLNPAYHLSLAMTQNQQLESQRDRLQSENTTLRNQIGQPRNRF